MRRSLSTSAVAAVAVLALAPAAGAEVYPGAMADRTFDAPSAWTIAPNAPTACAFTNILRTPLPLLCGFVGGQNTAGGVGNSGDLSGSYRAVVAASALNLVRIEVGTTTFTSPAFTAPQATGAATFSVDRNADVAALLALGSEQRFGVVLVDDTNGTQQVIFPLATLPVAAGFTTVAASIPGGSIMAGHSYRIEVTVTLGASQLLSADVLAGGSVSFDNVALSIPTAADPTGTVPGVPGSGGSGGSGGGGTGGTGGTGGGGTAGGSGVSGGTGGANGLAFGSSPGSTGPGGTVLVPGQGYSASQLALLLKSPYGKCTIWGTKGNDRLVGTPGRDIICGLGGNDLITGGKGSDVIYGDAPNGSKLVTGSDRIDGGDGNDIVYGGRGNDRMSGAAGKDRLFGGDGADTISGGSGNDVIHGNEGADKASGGAGNDTITGETGKDVLRGDAGSDSIAGGQGKDKLYGGAGTDVLNARDGHRDSLSGGSGRDRAHGDRVDRYVSIERR